MEEDFTIGIEQIDQQHRELLERMELLRDAMRRGKGREEVQRTLRFLEEYVVEHFSTEERYMLRHAYPGLLSHKAEHAKFLKDLTAFKEKFTAMESKGELTTFLGVDIVRKLNDWFTNHIFEVDKKMGSYLAEKMG
jgi:hemerythrin